ncbi:MAG TPA: hypothetical protein VNQ74_15345, partial [Burkholderiaceae bacterium]|nr:hypothetical protein [Burkholderiaceae bacterium]
MKMTFTPGSNCRAVWIRRGAALVALVAVTALAQPSGQAVGGDALPFAKGYTVTGNYIVGGVDLPAYGVNGYVTGAINMTGVPDGAEILAAFLYWETISTTTGAALDYEAKFRGLPIKVVKKSSQVLGSDVAGCWVSAGGGQATLNMYRADVLGLLPDQLDVDNKPTGRRLVNDADLTKYGYPAHTVTLPQATSSAFPHTAGASLFVIYRDTSQPLTRIVVFEGAHVQKPGAAMTQSIRGFFQSAKVPGVAKVTQLVGSRLPHSTDKPKFSKKGSNAASMALDATALNS